ncbi:MAG: fumarylacetoacetate hydrolase family protein [Myxococcales bacterium]
MKLATLADGTRDGRLVVVDQAGERYAEAAEVAPTLQAALDNWSHCESRLERLSWALSEGKLPGKALDFTQLAAPLPRAYEWVDGSAFLSHVIRVRRARNAEPPETLRTDPLVYQGGSGVLLAPRAPLVLPDASWGLDFEAEVCAVLNDTPRGIEASAVKPHICLFMLANDVTYRNLVPNELAKGFGFFQSKPATAFSPFALTPNELGSSYREGRVHLQLRCYLNGELVGDPYAGEMHFSFHDLVAHIAKTRAFTAGTILGSGTVSNDDEERGITCLAEQRARETIVHGSPRTPFLKIGDRVRIEMLSEKGDNLFGSIEQEVFSE